MNPIRLRRVDGLPTLVAGLHRIRAYRTLGREAIPAVTVDASDDEAALAEIDENRS
jgi:ParB-like chromosome segregation protein Spo0J